jgi:hypothetical protein
MSDKIKTDSVTGGRYIEKEVLFSIPLVGEGAVKDHDPNLNEHVHMKDAGGNDLPSYEGVPTDGIERFEYEIPELITPRDAEAELIELERRNLVRNEGMVAARECGSCSMCCKLMGVAEIKKPRGVMCTLHKRGKGCTVHKAEGMPKACDTFVCMWLGDKERMFGEDWRPDKLRLIWTTTAKEKVLAVWLHRRDKKQLRREDVMRTLVNLASAGYTVMGMIDGDVIPLAAPKGSVVQVR